MSPASKSKSKSSGKVAKEQQKASSKHSGSTSTGNGIPASAYNPISGTFHTLDTSSVATSPPYHDNGRFRNIDETDEHSSSPHGTLSEYDSVSNNGSCSGESEDPKEKFVNSTTRQDPIPGSDNDRREKIRIKNEKKHQRQKEKRAQELHERCCGYLMSRKLESLSQQLVSMGFSSERATLALMLNEGRVEESVNWLFEVSEEEARNKDPKLESGGNLKIDISEELARILAMEVRYKCSKQEIERAVVTCEGDLDKAEDSIKVQKQEPAANPVKPEDTADAKSMVRLQENFLAPVTIQQRRNERDFNYIKAAATVPSTYSEPGNRNLQSSLPNQSRLVDKRWTSSGSSPTVSLTATAPLQVVPPAKGDVRHAVIGNEGKNIQQVREPVIVMQRPQSMNAKQIPVSSVIASPSVPTGWYAKNVPAVENVRPNGKILQGTGSLGSTENQSSGQFHRQAPYKDIPYMHNPVDFSSAGLGGSWSTIGSSSPSLASPSKPRGTWSTMGMSSPSLAVPSSLGLFASWGSAGSLGSSSHVDWNTGGLMPECDYTSIDWTWDTNLAASKTSGLWFGLSSLLRNSPGMRMGSANGTCTPGLQDNGVVTETSSPAGLRDWTSPFAEKDMFSVPRQFVTSPSP
ncbi:Ubiquitin-associated/translation elongation factor EF1B protein [Melia azedarach]|uniref:Ubiquitin-associated/translation elongation factor EF1B protein n=1 Tax=Melia azedarach TaxID=155640 RepID=A0ACC1Y9J3_MELAZ|nr:Ubiquitin-associated/translation elongation factor EF1B protein [Melia azedarach]